jgi:hypothetical protein
MRFPAYDYRLHSMVDNPTQWARAQTVVRLRETVNELLHETVRLNAKLEQFEVSPLPTQLTKPIEDAVHHELVPVVATLAASLTCGKQRLVDLEQEAAKGAEDQRIDDERRAREARPLEQRVRDLEDEHERKAAAPSHQPPPRHIPRPQTRPLIEQIAFSGSAGTLSNTAGFIGAASAMNLVVADQSAGGGRILRRGEDLRSAEAQMPMSGLSTAPAELANVSSAAEVAAAIAAIGRR